MISYKWWSGAPPQDPQASSPASSNQINRLSHPAVHLNSSHPGTLICDPILNMKQLALPHLPLAVHLVDVQPVIQSAEMLSADK